MGSVCNTSVTIANPHVYILYTIYYATSDNTNTNGTAPIIHLNITDWQPGYSLSTECNSINSTRAFDNKVNITVMDCYCCNGQDTWQNCSNVPKSSIISTPTTFTKTSNSVRATTGLSVSNATTTTTFMPTSIPGNWPNVGSDPAVFTGLGFV